MQQSPYTIGIKNYKSGEETFRNLQLWSLPRVFFIHIIWRKTRLKSFFLSIHTHIKSDDQNVYVYPNIDSRQQKMYKVYKHPTNKLSSFVDIQLDQSSVDVQKDTISSARHVVTVQDCVMGI